MYIIWGSLQFIADLMIQEQSALIPIQEIDCRSWTQRPAF